MRVKRNKFNEHIVQKIINGEYPGYTNSKNGHKCWALYPGRKSIYSHDKTAPGVTLILSRPHSSTYISLSCGYQEVAEYITNHEMNFFDYIEQDKKLGEYLRSEEGKWGRQDSF